MSEDKMRSTFESWYCKKFTFENMARRADGTYRGEHAFNSWVSWQAALSQSEPEVSQPVATWEERAKLAGDWPCFSGDQVAPYMRAEIIDLRAFQKVQVSESVKVSQPVAFQIIETNKNNRLSFTHYLEEVPKTCEVGNVHYTYKINPIFLAPPDYEALRAENEALKEQLIRSESDAARHRFCMDWQDKDSQPEEILDMFKKVFATGRLKPTKEEYNAAIDAAIQEKL